jgi:hypothetical protein
MPLLPLPPTAALRPDGKPISIRDIAINSESTTLQMSDRLTSVQRAFLTAFVQQCVEASVNTRFPKVG